MDGTTVLFYFQKYIVESIMDPAPEQLSTRNALYLYLYSILAREFTFISEFQQIRILSQLGVCTSAQAATSHVDIRFDVLDQALLAHVVVLGPNEAQNEQIHMTVVEVLLEIMHDVDFDAAHGVLVIRIPANGHDHGVDRAFVVRPGVFLAVVKLAAPE